MRVAIIGGTFDPIHLGHIAMARYVLSKHLCEEVWFMVAKDTPLKHRVLTPMDIRIHMCEMALKPFKKMRVCTLEKELPGVSYTIQTIKELQNRFPLITFSWIIGGDQASKLDKWKDINELVRRIAFWVFPRDKQTIDCAYPHHPMQKELLDVSSSEIRRGQKRQYLPRCLQSYLGKYPLYIEEYAQANMSEKRYEHSIRVTNLCIELARLHGVNPEQAYMAGLLHDVCKEWDDARSEVWMKHMEPSRIQEPKAIWHAYIGASYISKVFGIHNKDVARAMYYHTIGSMISSLTMILYIADKIEPGRGYDVTKETNLAKKDLKTAYQMVQEQQKMYLKKEIL